MLAHGCFKILGDGQVREIDQEGFFPRRPHLFLADVAIKILIERVIHRTLNGIVRTLHQFGVDRRRCLGKATVGILPGQEGAQFGIVKG